MSCSYCDGGLTLIYNEICENHFVSLYQNINEASQADFVTTKCPSGYKCTINMNFFNGNFNEKNLYRTTIHNLKMKTNIYLVMSFLIYLLLRCI